MSGAPARITLLTDFGTADGYVAAMKGVIAAILPSAIIDDAAHDIPPGDVHAASWALGAYWRLYPPGTVHVAVVDPGVGSARRALALEVDQRIIIAPDNGIVTAVLLHAQVSSGVAITAPHILRPDVSSTFHGRDVFAPAAAHVAAGAPLRDLGPPASDPVRLPVTELVRAGTAVIGAVIHVDRFGNLVTDIPGSVVTGGRVEVHGDRSIAVVRTYADVATGEAAALIGSRGTLEVSVRDASAARILGMKRGAPVAWIPPDDEASDAAPDIQNVR